MKAGIFRNTKSGELLYVGKDRGIRAFTAGGMAHVMREPRREEFKVRAKGDDVLLEDGTLCQRVDYGLSMGTSGSDPSINLEMSIQTWGTDADREKIGMKVAASDCAFCAGPGFAKAKCPKCGEGPFAKMIVESTPTRVSVDQFKATFDAARDAMKAVGDQAKNAAQNFQQFRREVLHPKEGRDHGWCGKQAARKHRKRGHIVRKIANGEYSWER